jgi:hypothetical protein
MHKPKGRGDPALRKQKHRKLFASGARTNKGTWHEMQMFDAYLRRLGKAADERQKQSGRNKKKLCPSERKAWEHRLDAMQASAERRYAKIRRISILEELKSIKRHVGLPESLIPEIAKIIFENKIPMENVYAYYKKRKQSNLAASDEQIWKDFLKYSIQRARLFYNR